MAAVAAAGLMTISCKTVEEGPTPYDPAKSRYGSGGTTGGGGGSRKSPPKVVREEGPVYDDDPTTPEPIPVKDDIPPGTSPLRHDKPDEPIWTR